MLIGSVNLVVGRAHEQYLAEIYRHVQIMVHKTVCVCVCVWVGGGTGESVIRTSVQRTCGEGVLQEGAL